VVRQHDDPRNHDDQRYDLPCYRHGAAAEPLVQPEISEGNGDNRVARRDDGQHRRKECALLEGVLIEHEAHRADHSQRVDRPVGQYVRQAPAEVRHHELDQECRSAVTDAAGQGQRERAQVPAAGGNREAARYAGGESYRERQDDEKADG
jgi:hypothetical protein